MSLNLILGNLLLAFGVMKIGMYFFRNKQTLPRLEALRARWGERGGTFVYLLIYAALPVLVACLILFREYRLNR